MKIFAANPASLLSRIHPGLRLVAALLFALFASFLRGGPALLLALFLGFTVLVLSRRPLWQALRRTLFLNLALAGLGATIAFGHGGEPWFALGILSISREGAWLALAILARANAILWASGGLLGSMDPAEIGYALDRLRVPPRLTHILLFMVRYIETVHHEYHRVRDAMDARAFRPAMTLHALRSFGNLLGVLLLRSLERSERILAAMRCRGFDGRFYLLRGYPLRPLDCLFGCVTSLFLLALLMLEAWR